MNGLQKEPMNRYYAPQKPLQTAIWKTHQSQCTDKNAGLWRHLQGILRERISHQPERVGQGNPSAHRAWEYISDSQVLRP